MIYPCFFDENVAPMQQIGKTRQVRRLAPNQRPGVLIAWPPRSQGKTPVNKKPKKPAVSPARLVGSGGAMQNQKRHMSAVH
jgi:hypothetical protein